MAHTGDNVYEVAAVCLSDLLFAHELLATRCTTITPARAGHGLATIAPGSRNWLVYERDLIFNKF